MKKVLIAFVACITQVANVYSQDISQRLQKAYQRFETDSQLRHATSSLYVIDAKTGHVVFDKNSQVGLAPASTQKIITSVTAFELLGKEYRYKTELGLIQPYDGDSVVTEAIIMTGYGDPSFGSWRYAGTKPDEIFKKIKEVLNQKKVARIPDLNVYADDTKWGTHSLPDGWIWQDIGNYYGAGASSLNWKENQYDIYMKSGDKVGDSCFVVAPTEKEGILVCEVKAAAKGSGDNAYVYQAPNTNIGYIRGTIPVGEKSFKISASLPDPALRFGTDFIRATKKGNDYDDRGAVTYQYPTGQKPGWWLSLPKQTIYTFYSPTLDSLIYWFNKKSINLYGEALIKTFAYEKMGIGSTDSGVNIVKRFWKEKGLDDEELNIYDGSGLSPLNRVTSHAQVEILKYAKTRDWYPSFLNALPIYNEMTMKSGTISDVKGFCGYHKAKDGREYIFSFLVNNYSGRASLLVNKMYKVLDELK